MRNETHFRLLGYPRGVGDLPRGREWKALVVETSVGERLVVGLVLELPGDRPQLDLHHSPLPMCVSRGLLGGS